MNLDELIYALRRVRESVGGEVRVGVFDSITHQYPALRTIVYTRLTQSDESLVLGLSPEDPFDLSMFPLDGIALEWADPKTFSPLVGQWFISSPQLDEEED